MINQHLKTVDTIYYHQKLFKKVNSEFNASFLSVSAPSGYGKSTFVMEWLKNQRAQWEWLDLEVHDNNIEVFIQRLFTLFQNRDTQFDSENMEILAGSGNNSIAELVALFINTIKEIDHDQFIVLDNYENITNVEIGKFLESIITNLPSRFRIILISKTIPDLPIEEWQTKGKIYCLETKDFSFDIGEITSFIKTIYNRNLDRDYIHFIYKKTEGWITGIKLLAQISGNFKDTHTLISGDCYCLDNYFKYKILDKQPEIIKKVLSLTALFDRFSISMIQNIINCVLKEKEGSREENNYIDYILQNNLFIIQTSPNRQWFRYHLSFQDFLLRITNDYTDGKERQKTYFIIGEWYESRNFIKEALESYLSGGHSESAKNLIINIHQKLFESERSETLDSYINLFSLEQQREFVELLIIKAWIYAIQGNGKKSLGILSEIEKNTSYFPITSKLFRGELLLLKSIKYMHQFNSIKKLNYVIKALGALPENAGFFKAWAFTLKFSAYMMNAEYSRGIQILRDAHCEVNSIQPHFKCRLYWIEAIGCLLKNDLVNLHNTAKYLKQTALTNNLKESTASSIFFLLVYYYQTDDIPKVKETYLDLIEYRPHCQKFMMLQAIYIRSLVFLEEGEKKKALELVMDFENMCYAENNHQLCIYAKYFSLDIKYRVGHRIYSAMMEEDFLSIQPNLIFEAHYPHLIIIKLFIAIGTEEHLKTAQQLLTIVKNWIEKSHIDMIRRDILILEAIINHKMHNPIDAREKLGEALKISEEQGGVRFLLNYKKELIPILGKAFYDKFMLGSNLNNLYNEIKGLQNPIDTPPRVSTILTNREIDIIELMALRFSNKEIATKLYIEPNSVKRHTIRIYKKINVNSRNQAVERAYQLNIL